MLRSILPLAKATQRFAPKAVRFLPTVKDHTIKIVFVDTSGNRVTLPARIGQNLLEVARWHKVDIEGPCKGGGAPTDVQRTKDWNETTYGEGPTCFWCHVQIPLQYHHLLPQPQETELEGIKQNWDEEFNVSSRLACQIRLEKKHDGMVVFVPDAPPTNVI
eukprot:gene3995-4274_t